MQQKDYILYVDDNEVNLQLFAEYLSDTYEVIIEPNPQRAWDSLAKFPVKVIVSDQRMPEEEGLVFLDKVHRAYPDIIKILCTAYVDEDSAIRAINQGGIFHYIAKPYSYEYMRDIIGHAVNEYNLRQENKRLIRELQRNNSIIQQAFNQIKEQQIKLYSIFEQSSDGIVVIRKNEVLEANPAFIKIFSITTTERILLSCTQVLQKNYPDFLEKIAAYAPLNSSFEYELSDKQQHRRYIEVRPAQIDFMSEKAILAIIRDITERRETEQKILEAIITTQENEQRRYARELHDGIGPLLSTLKMYVEWLGNPELPNSNQIFTAALQTIDETIRQAKNLANRMSPHILERFGLVHALTEYLEKIKHATNINYQLTLPTSLKLPPSTEMALYRIFMEAIHNTLKYAAASSIFIEIKSENTGISVTYKDNGKGFDCEKATIESKGMGLFNIQNRVKILHGQCKFHSEPNKGFAMEIFLPAVE